MVSQGMTAIPVRLLTQFLVNQIAERGDCQCSALSSFPLFYSEWNPRPWVGTTLLESLLPPLALLGNAPMETPKGVPHWKCFTNVHLNLMMLVAKIHYHNFEVE